MTLITDEQIEALIAKGVKVPTVSETCIGCGACVAIAGDVFDLNEEGMSVVKFQESYENLGTDDAIGACPVNAISWKN